MFYETAKNNHGLPYNPFKSCVVPRPLGWVSTVSHDGIINLAPFSMFNMLGEEPPIVMISINRLKDGQLKDTAANIARTLRKAGAIASRTIRSALASAAARCVSG